MGRYQLLAVLSEIGKVRGQESKAKVFVRRRNPFSEFGEQRVLMTTNVQRIHGQRWASLETRGAWSFRWFSSPGAFHPPQGLEEAGDCSDQVWMITWMAMVSSRDRPREGAWGAQRTKRGGAEGAYRGTWRHGDSGRSLISCHFGDQKPAL